MKVLLVNPPIRTNAPPQHLPIGLGIVANVLRSEGHKVEILDINAYRLQKSDVQKHFLEKNYDLIGIGGLITTYSYVKWLINEVRKLKPDSRIVVGGGVVTENPMLLKKTPLDIAVIGEGEETIREIAEGIPLEEIKGIAYKTGDRIKTNPSRPLIKDLDELPFPAYDLFPMEIYLRQERAVHQDPLSEA